MKNSSLQSIQGAVKDCCFFVHVFELGATLYRGHVVHLEFQGCSRLFLTRHDLYIINSCKLCFALYQNVSNTPPISVVDDRPEQPISTSAAPAVLAIPRIPASSISLPVMHPTAPILAPSALSMLATRPVVDEPLLISAAQLSLQPAPARPVSQSHLNITPCVLVFWVAFLLLIGCFFLNFDILSRPLSFLFCRSAPIDSPSAFDLLGFLRSVDPKGRLDPFEVELRRNCFETPSELQDLTESACKEMKLPLRLIPILLERAKQLYTTLLQTRLVKIYVFVVYICYLFQHAVYRRL
jgi:hypothetical protein